MTLELVTEAYRLVHTLYDKRCCYKLKRIDKAERVFKMAKQRLERRTRQYYK